ncbi:MAG: PKD domain-containing protein, partial [Actinomycetota bacterium]|nr:PKD domain-containing protein [Actinomycetota bacterium]
VICLLGLGVLLLCAPAQAEAVPAWLPPMDLVAAGQHALSPQAAFDAQGDAVAVWLSIRGSKFIVQAAVRPAASGVWQAPVDLSAAGQDAEAPQVAVDARGNALAIWRSNGVVQAAVRSAASGVWQAPVDLSAADAGLPQIALDAQGNALVVWADGTNSIVQAAARPAATGLWQPAASPPVNTAAMHVAFDTQGNAFAVWAASNGTNSIVQAAVRPAASDVWQTPTDLSTAGQDADGAQVAVDAQGNALAVWRRFDGTNHVVQAAARPAASGVWQAPIDLSAAGQNADGLQLAVDSQGDALAVWECVEGTKHTVQAAARSAASGVWQAPLDLSLAGQAVTSPQVAFDARGNALAVWERYTGSYLVVAGAVRPAASGRWQQPRDLSAAGQTALDPRLAVDRQGNALVTWDRAGGYGDVQAAAWDGAAPLLKRLSVPTTGKAGQALAFRVAPRDVWSSIGTTRWQFGDGTAATRANATHTYSKAGSYQVRVTSSDALGNTTSTTSNLVISTVRPIISGARLSHQRWRQANDKNGVTHPNAPIGTTFSFTLNAPAQVSFAFTMQTPGRRVKGACVTATAINQARPRCSRTTRQGSLSFAAKPGRNEHRFTGAIPLTKGLRPGTYTVTITATNTTGHTKKPTTLHFTIVH